jgi:hypothetical protein
MENAFLVQALFAAGRFGEARNAWAGMVSDREAATNALFDGDFRGLPAPPPFNWTLHDTAVGRATMTNAGKDAPYLDVEYFGGSGAVLAEQVMALRPGRYSIRLLASTVEPIKGASFVWRIGCLPSGQEQVSLELRALAASPREYGTSFSVPHSGCGGQKLELIGRPGDVAAPANIRIAKFRVAPNG